MTEKTIDLLPKRARVLVQLSGGKDSIACMILLKKHHVDFEAIHFTHHYGYALPTKMAKDTCKTLDVELHIYDISDELESKLLDTFRDRPCRCCKSIMDSITVEFATKHGFTFICIGDTKDDKMLLNRISALEGKANPISHYINKNVVLPKDMFVFRPLIHCNSEDTLAMVLSAFPNFKRVHDTGDKYFEYSREGCPLQFKDLGFCYTKELMSDLKMLNYLCSEFASKKGIRASIHLPSEFIVTIPRGYEDECRQYLIKHGVQLRSTTLKNTLLYRFVIDILLNSSMKEMEILDIACNRFIERLGFQETISFEGASAMINNTNESVGIMLEGNNRLIISITSKDKRWGTGFIENICIEVFHTWNFNVFDYKIQETCK